MTHLELVAEIGSGPMEIVKLYLKGCFPLLNWRTSWAGIRLVWSIPLRLTAGQEKSGNYCCQD